MSSLPAPSVSVVYISFTFLGLVLEYREFPNAFPFTNKIHEGLIHIQEQL